MNLISITRKLEESVEIWLGSHVGSTEDVSWALGITEDVEDVFVSIWVILDDDGLIFESKSSIPLAEANQKTVLEKLSEVWDLIQINKMASNTLS